MTKDTALRELIEGALVDSGAVLEDVVVTPAGRRRVVKVVVDRVVTTEGDITQTVESLTLDEIAAATRTVSDVLDESDVLGEQPYTLEVTSPGVSRPLTAALHFRRNVGRLVVLTLQDGPAVTGRITRAGVDDLTLDVPAAKKSPARSETIAYAGIDRAEVQVEFSRKDSHDDTAPDEIDTDETGADEFTDTEETGAAASAQKEN